MISRPVSRHVCDVPPNARAARRAVVLAWVAERGVITGAWEEEER